MPRLCHDSNAKALLSLYWSENKLKQKTLFLRSRQNSYLLHAFEFGYNDFGRIVISPIASLPVGPAEYFFVYNDSCKFNLHFEV